MLNNTPSQTNAKNIRIVEEQLYQVDAMYDSRPNGVQRLLSFSLKVGEMLKEEIRGYFTEAEINAIVDNENGTLIDERYWGNKRMFLISLEDGFEMDGLGARWEVSFEEVKSKINSMSDPAFLYFHEAIYRFWNEAPSYGSPTPSLEKFKKDFL